MNRRFAENTSVSPEKTQADITRLLIDYGAKDYMTGWEGNAAIVMFRMKNRAVRVVVPMPAPGEKQFSKRTADASRKAWEQRIRERWRGLFFILKAKLVAVAEGIESFEEIFLSNLQTAGGTTIGKTLLPHLDAVLNGNALRALPAPSTQEKQPPPI